MSSKFLEFRHQFLPLISMDTKFPDVIVCCPDATASAADPNLQLLSVHYAILKVNVDLWGSTTTGKTRLSLDFL